jgi:hypothetical protein
MRTESYIVAELLQRLEQQGGALRPHAVEVAAALSQDQYSAALEASTALTHVLDKFVATTELLQDHIVAHDGMGKLGESLGELALRARGLVVVAQLDLLCEAFRAPAVQVRARGWFVGQLHGIADVRTSICDQLTKIHAIWTPYRQDQTALPDLTGTERVTVYRTMVRVAQRALRNLRDEPDLARFLERGIAATDLPEVHLPCKQIDTMLALQIGIDPARPLPRHNGRIAEHAGVPEPR